MKRNLVVNNVKWIVLCKAAQAVLQLVIGMLMARYLGPANYGLINYAKSIMAFFIPITMLGIDATIIRELIQEPEKEGEILGTSMVMSFLAGISSMVLIGGFVSIVNRGEPITILVCLLYSCSLLLQALAMIQYWFHYKLQSKFSSVAVLIAYVVASIYKLYLLATGKNVYWFAVALAVENGISGLLMFVFLKKQCEHKLSASISMANKLLSRSRYYILSSLMVTVFQNTDHVMLKLMGGDAENGIYTAAITCATVGSFVYAAIVDSVRPVILTNKKKNEEDYEHSISGLYCLIVYLSLAQAVVFALLAKPIVWVLYGSEYSATAPVLQVLIWYMTFAQIGRIRNIWILAEEKQAILWKINLAGALMNAAVNFLLIPIWGAMGAAMASLMTQIFANLILGYVVKSLRKNNVLLMKGMDPRFLATVVRDVVDKLGSRTKGEDNE